MFPSPWLWKKCAENISVEHDYDGRAWVFMVTLTDANNIWLPSLPIVDAAWKVLSTGRLGRYTRRLPCLRARLKFSLTVAKSTLLLWPLSPPPFVVYVGRHGNVQQGCATHDRDVQPPLLQCARIAYPLATAVAFFVFFSPPLVRSVFSWGIEDYDITAHDFSWAKGSFQPWFWRLLCRQRVNKVY